VAVNCWLWPTARLGLDGVTEMEVSTALVPTTVTVAVADARVTVMVVDPAETMVTRPAALTVATPAFVL
jgi:hypothetical protein